MSLHTGANGTTHWMRLNPRMLLVHPVHEVLRQLPLVIGSLVFGSATGNPWWVVLALVLTVTIGVLRWFTTGYRIAPDEIQLRADCCNARCCRCHATGFARSPLTPGCCTDSSG